MNNKYINAQSDYTRLSQQGDLLIFDSSLKNEGDKNIQGSLSNIRNLLNKHKLTSISLEDAINHTEDLIMPLLSSLPKRDVLVVEGPEFERVFELLRARTDSVMVSLDVVENLYRQLADYSQGSQFAWQETISAEHVALGLVILREIMQHGGFRLVLLSAAIANTIH